jgi:hypothetical protein
MSWSKTNKGRKPLGWWYHKIMCEFAYHFKGSSSNMYYHHLLAMSTKYNLNLYGQETKPMRINNNISAPNLGGITPGSELIHLLLDKPFQPRLFDEHIKKTFEEAAKAARDFTLAMYMITPNDELPENAVEFLNQRLKEAIETENYEEAARIRDKMNEG